MNLDYISSYIDKKIEEDKFKVVFSFYELRIKSNLSNEELQTFLELASIKLRNLGYSVYYTGENYKYENEYKLVEANEMLIAIKNEPKNIKVYSPFYMVIDFFLLYKSSIR